MKTLAQKLKAERKANKESIDGLTYDNEELESELEKTTSKLNKANAKITLGRRREELGEWSDDMTDEDILDIEKYQKAKATMLKEKKKLEDSTADDDSIGEAHASDEMDSFRTNVDKEAFPENYQEK